MLIDYRMVTANASCCNTQHQLSLLLLLLLLLCRIGAWVCTSSLMSRSQQRETEPRSQFPSANLFVRIAPKVYKRYKTERPTTCTLPSKYQLTVCMWCCLYQDVPNQAPRSFSCVQKLEKCFGSSADEVHKRNAQKNLAFTMVPNGWTESVHVGWIGRQSNWRT